MKRFYLFPLFFLFFITANAQNISVKSFRDLPMDMTSLSREGKRIDQNGDVAALIKVVTNETGFLFEGGTLGIVDTKQNIGEIWVWVPRGLRKITIKHQVFGVLRDYRFPLDIESERTYEMVLDIPNLTPDPVQEEAYQFLLFNLTPRDAVLTVDGELWAVTEGTSQKMVLFGKHEYRVEANGYHSDAGIVVVNDPDNTVEVNVVLESVDSNKDDKANDVKADPKANHLTVTLKVDADAEIWVNNEMKGIRTWKGELTTGTYVIETRMENHRPAVEQKEITEEMLGQTIPLTAPTPITGTLVVNSTPAKVKFYVDGIDYGETPKRINNILIGEHTVKIVKPNCFPLTRKVTIEEDKTVNIEEKLEYRTITVFTDHKGDKVSVDGEYVGVSPVSVIMPLGKYLVHAERGAKTADKEIVVEKEGGETWYTLVPTDGKVYFWSRGVNFITLNGAYSPAPQTSYGIAFGSVKKVGWFITGMSNFNFDAKNADLVCDSDGLVDGEYLDYTGESITSRLSVMGGLMMRIAGPLCLRLGAGYGSRDYALRIGGGSLVKVAENCYSGVDVTAGLQLNLRGFVMSVDAVTNKFQTIEVKVGLGYCWKRK